MGGESEQFAVVLFSILLFALSDCFLEDSFFENGEQFVWVANQNSLLWWCSSFCCSLSVIAFSKVDVCDVIVIAMNMIMYWIRTYAPA